MGRPPDGVDLDLDASPVELVLEVDLRERKGAVQRRDPRLPRRDPNLATSRRIPDAPSTRHLLDGVAIGSSPLDGNFLVKKHPTHFDFPQPRNHALRSLPPGSPAGGPGSDVRAPSIDAVPVLGYDLLRDLGHRERDADAPRDAYAVEEPPDFEPEPPPPYFRGRFSR